MAESYLVIKDYKAGLLMSSNKRPCAIVIMSQKTNRCVELNSRARYHEHFSEIAPIMRFVPLLL